MPYKDEDKQRDYMRRLMQKRSAGGPEERLDVLIRKMAQAMSDFHDYYKDKPKEVQDEAFQRIRKALGLPVDTPKERFVKAYIGHLKENSPEELQRYKREHSYSDEKFEADLPEIVTKICEDASPDFYKAYCDGDVSVFQEKPSENKPIDVSTQSSEPEKETPTVPLEKSSTLSKPKIPSSQEMFDGLFKGWYSSRGNRDKGETDLSKSQKTGVANEFDDMQKARFAPKTEEQHISSENLKKHRENLLKGFSEYDDATAKANMALDYAQALMKYEGLSFDIAKAKGMEWVNLVIRLMKQGATGKEALNNAEEILRLSVNISPTKRAFQELEKKARKHWLDKNEEDSK